MFKKIFFSLFLFSFTFAPAFAANVLVLQDEIPFGKDTEVTEAVKSECQLQTKIPTFVKEFSKERFDKIISGKADAKDAKILSMEIYDVEGRGGGAWSGHKSLAIKGTLTQGGKVIGSFRAKRYSGGGAFGGYKGTCAILGRCTKALGKDVAGWLASPTMDARLGDM